MARKKASEPELTQEQEIQQEEQAQRQYTDEELQEAYKQARNDLKQHAPLRQVEVPDEQKKKEGVTLSEALSFGEDLTDLQYALKRLLPSVLDENSSMIGRIDPNTMLPVLHLMSVSEIMKADPKGNIDVNAIYLKNYIRLSIGLDGRGRIDVAQLLGAAREEKRMEKSFAAGGL